MNLKWSGKTALITGGSCDIAIVLAKLLLVASITPVLTFRNEEGKEKIERALTPYLKEMKSSHLKYQTFFLDYSKPDSLDNINDNSGNGFDYLIDFAQGNFEDLIASADNKRAGSFLNENIIFRAKMLKIVSRIMLKQKRGRLVFISSTAAKSPNLGQGFYSAVKLAGEALYKNIGIEFGKKGITTISLRLGYVNAGRGEKYLINNGKEILKRIPVRMALLPSEVAETIMFFLSESARGFNATEIVMDGGLTSGK